MTLRIMLDLETMSTSANAAIVSIGACANDGRPDFYMRVDLESCMHAGLKVDASTIMWWMQQNDEARKALYDGARSLRDALLLFAHWLGQSMHTTSDPGEAYGQVECELWAYPAQFDVTILSEAYKAFGKKEPWHYRAPRCLRTAAALFPGVERVKADTEHDALSDAKAQMAWLEKIDATLGAMRECCKLALETVEELALETVEEHEQSAAEA